MRPPMRGAFLSTSPISEVNLFMSKITITKMVCRDILMTALPRNVARKNVLNGISMCPQVNPAKSKNGFGTEANSNMPQNPIF